MDNWLLRYAVDLAKRDAAIVQHPRMLAYPGNNRAHTIEIMLTRDGGPVTLGGATVACYFMRSDMQAVLTVGEVTEKGLSVSLAQGCYAYPGEFVARIQVSLADGGIVPVLTLTGVIGDALPGQIIDPGEVVPDIAAIQAMMQEMQRMIDAVGNMTVSAVKLPPNASPTATISWVNGRIHIGFGLPPGDPGGGTGDMTKAVYDSANNGVVNNSRQLGGVPAAGYVQTSRMVYGKPLTADVLPADTANMYSNPYFQMWSRGTSFSNVVPPMYTADRWQSFSNMVTTIALHEYGLMQTAQASGNYIGVRQPVEMSPQVARNLVGKTLYLRRRLNAGQDCELDNGMTVPQYTPTEWTAAYTFTEADVESVNANGCFYPPSPTVYALAGGSALPAGFWVIWMAAQCTLGDPGMMLAPTNYAADLAQCQRYYQAIDTLVLSAPYGDGTTWYYVASVGLPSTLRAYPVVSYDSATMGGVGAILASDITITVARQGFVYAYVRNRAGVPGSANYLQLTNVRLDAEFV